MSQTLINSLQHIPNVSLIKDRVRVYWGGWSQVQATINLILAAKSYDTVFDRYALMSGACYPTRSNDELRAFLYLNSTEYISCRAIPDLVNHKSLARLTKWTFEGGYRERGIKAFALRAMNAALRLLPDRNISTGLCGFKPHAGSSWWVLTSRAIDHILFTMNKYPELPRYFQTTKMPDESFFQTILANSSFESKLHKSLTFADWTHPNERPCTIDESHLALLLDPKALHIDTYGSAPIFFARKFGERNHEILSQIDLARS